MHTFREKLSFFLTAAAYVVFHLRLGATWSEVLLGTVQQMLVTAPYAIAFTYVSVLLLRHFSDGRRPPWDRVVRIFFTVGIGLGLFFALYEYGERAQDRPPQVRALSAAPTAPGDSRKGPWRSA